MADRNFDDLAKKFARKIYGGSKGDIRMAVLNRDLQEMGLLERPPNFLLDAGGGFGFMAQQFAELGTDADVVDISQTMLIEGQETWQERLKASKNTLQWGQIDWYHRPLQADVSDFRTFSKTKGQYPLVCSHAVLEWVEEPERVLDVLVERVEPGGFLSLMVFNQVSLVWKNVLFGRLQKVLEERLHGYGNSLTPKHAFSIEQIQGWLTARGMEVRIVSGVRIFHDFMKADLREQLWSAEQEAFLELELRYSRDPVHQQMARYLHFVCSKPKPD